MIPRLHEASVVASPNYQNNDILSTFQEEGGRVGQTGPSNGTYTPHCDCAQPVARSTGCWQIKKVKLAVVWCVVNSCRGSVLDNSTRPDTRPSNLGVGPGLTPSPYRGGGRLDDSTRPGPSLV